MLYAQRMDGAAPGNTEREFRAPTDEGEIVGWVRDGPAVAAPALLMHGGPGLSDYLLPLADELDGLFPIARYQQRGLAPSTEAGERDVQRHVEDAVAVLDGLGSDTAIVIGHSWGGHLAMHFAAAHPERIAGLVSLDPLGAVGDGGLGAFVARLASQIPTEQRPRYDEIQALESLTASERDESFRMVWPYYFGDPTRSAPFIGFRYDMRSAATWTSIKAHFEARTLELKLPNVTAPFLLIHGDASPLPIVQAERTVALVANSRLVAAPGIGHWAWLESPGLVRREIDRWLVDISDLDEVPDRR